MADDPIPHDDNTVDERLQSLRDDHEARTKRPNELVGDYNGLFQRYVHPALTADHVPH